MLLKSIRVLLLFSLLVIVGCTYDNREIEQVIVNEKGIIKDIKVEDNGKLRVLFAPNKKTDDKVWYFVNATSKYSVGDNVIISHKQPQVCGTSIPPQCGALSIKLSE